MIFIIFIKRVNIYMNPYYPCIKAISVTIPKEKLPRSDFTLSHEDCHECTILRLIQIMFQNGNQVSVSLLKKKHASLDVIDYFTQFPFIGDDEFYSTVYGQVARNEWSVLLSRRKGVKYVRPSGFELEAGIYNFIAAIGSLFPINLSSHYVERGDQIRYYMDALQYIGEYMSFKAHRIEFTDVVWTSTKDSSPRNVFPETPSGVTSAENRICTATFCVNGQPWYRIQWWDSYFLFDKTPDPKWYHMLVGGHVEMCNNETDKNCSFQPQHI